MWQRRPCFLRPDSPVPWPVTAHTRPRAQPPQTHIRAPSSKAATAWVKSPKHPEAVTWEEPSAPAYSGELRKVHTWLRHHQLRLYSVPFLGRDQKPSFICLESEFIWHPLTTLYYSVNFPFPRLLRSPQTPWESGSTLRPLPSNTIPWMPLLCRRCISAQPWAPKHQPMKLCWLCLKSLPPSGALKPQALSMFARIYNARVSCLGEKRLHTVEEVKYRSPGVGLQLLLLLPPGDSLFYQRTARLSRRHLGKSSAWSHLLRKSHHPDPCQFIPLIAAFQEPPSSLPRVPKPVTIQNLLGRNNCFLHWNNIDNHTYLLCQVWNSCLSFPPTYPMPTALELLWNTIWEKSSSQIFKVSIHKKAKKK